MSEREEDGDGVVEEEGGGAGRVEEGQGEDEGWADDVERVKASQTDHQAVESVDLLVPRAVSKNLIHICYNSNGFHLNTMMKKMLPSIPMTATPASKTPSM